jgi:hypothetical protein
MRNELATGVGREGEGKRRMSSLTESQKANIRLREGVDTGMHRDNTYSTYREYGVAYYDDSRHYPTERRIFGHLSYYERWRLGVRT